MRWLTPVVLLGASAVVFWMNSQGEQQVLVFSFIPRLFPSTEGDIFAQGRASAGLLAGIGLLSVFWQLSVSRRLAARDSELE